MLYEYMLSLGYTKKEIDTILNTYPINTCREETIYKYVKDIYNFLIDFGFDGKSIIKMTIVFPSMYARSVNLIDKKIKWMIKLGYSREDVIKMMKNYPNICCYGIDKMSSRIKELMDLGYSYEDTIKISKNFPQIFSFSIDNIKQKINYLMELGYSYEAIIAIIRNYPIVCGYNMDYIKNKIEAIINLGYNREEVIDMTKKFPSLFGYSIDSFLEKKNFYDSIGLSELLKKDTKQLMQSIELSYARYEFYKSVGIDIDMSNYRLLFVNRKDFVNKYGISNEELMDSYNYDKYLLSKGIIRTKKRGCK